MLVFYSRLKVFLSFLVLGFLLSTCTEEEERKRAFPQVRTLEVESIAAGGAVFKGEIREANQPILEYGFVWSTTNSVNGLLSRIVLGSVEGNKVFEAVVEHDLVEEQLYYVWAYAKTSSHIVYGDVKSFQSLGSKAPVINSIEPRLVTWLDTLVINGENFSKNDANILISINGVSLPVISNSLTEIKARIPLDFHGPKGKVALSVLGNSTSVKDSIELKAPLISSIEPLEGIPGDEVTISGSSFHPALGSVYFNDIEAEIISLTKDIIRCRVPEGLSRGAISVRVSAASQFVIFAGKFQHKHPILTGFSPAEGTFDDQVIIFGEDFSVESTTTVHFGSIQATVISVSETEIIVTVPSVTEVEPKIRISNDGRTFTSDEPFRMLPPEIHSFTPIVEGAGDYITIAGRNFNPNGNNTVDIDFQTVPTITMSSTELKAQVPGGNGKHEMTVALTVLDTKVTAQGNVKLRWAFHEHNQFFSIAADGVKAWHRIEMYAGIQNGNNRLWVFNPYSFTVRNLASFPGRARFGYAFFLVNDNLFIAGGFPNQDPTPFQNSYREVWQYNIPTNTWTQRADLPFSGQINEMIGFSHGDKGFVIHFGKLYRYYPETDTWIEKDIQLPETPSGRGTLVGSDYFFKPVSNSMTHPVMRYNVVDDVWETLNADFNLNGRPTFAFAYQGRPVFGNDLGFSMYNPVTNQWTTRSFTKFRNARFGFEYNSLPAFFDEVRSRIYTFKEDF